MSTEKDPKPGADTAQDTAPDADRNETSEDRALSFTRRALVHAGWAVPVVMAVNPPQAFALTHFDALGSHSDSAHNDFPFHSDAHNDALPGGSHIDSIPHSDNPLTHFDNTGPGAHTDSAHIDAIV